MLQNPDFFEKQPKFPKLFLFSLPSYDWSWQCQNRCAVSKIVMGLPQSNQATPNWVSGGCILADHAMLPPYYHSCSSYVDPNKRFFSSKQFLFRDFKLPTDFTCFLFFDCYFIPYNSIRYQKLQQVKYAQDGS